MQVSEPVVEWLTKSVSTEPRVLIFVASTVMYGMYLLSYFTSHSNIPRYAEFSFVAYFSENNVISNTLEFIPKFPIKNILCAPDVTSDFFFHYSQKNYYRRDTVRSTFISSNQGFSLDTRSILIMRSWQSTRILILYIILHIIFLIILF